MSYHFTPGDTSKSVDIKLRDTTTGLGKTGLAFNSAGARAAYHRPGAVAADIALVTLANAAAAWSSGGFVEIDAAKCPGLYRLDVPDAVLAGGVPYATVSLGFTGAFDEDLHIDLNVAGMVAAAVAPLATNTNLALVFGDTNAIRLKTDQLAFTIPLQVDANALSGSGGSSIGPGSIPWPITVDDGTNPLDGAAVWVSTDPAGSNVVAGTLYTDAFGVANFMLDAGTYYAWVQHARYNGTNPTSFTVT